MCVYNWQMPSTEIRMYLQVEDMSPEAVMMAAIKGKGNYDKWRLED